LIFIDLKTSDLRAAQIHTDNMDINRYPDSRPVDRVVRVIESLAGNTLNGLSPGEIGKAAGASPAQITRLLAQLIRRGVVESARTEGRYRLGPAIVQIARAHELELARAERDLAEARQRYSRSPTTTTTTE
jgi:DNA-binding IclR family transcriptional regulator